MIGKVDGILALQKGLVPGLWYQIFMNGVRLGSYQTLVNMGATKNSNGEVDLLKSIFAGSFSGCMGAIVGSPFYLVKTQLQSQAVDSIAVGHQHRHQGMLNALKNIIKREGIPGLYRGVSGAMARVSVGSGAQLSTFSKAREMVKSTGYFKETSIMIPILASMTSSVVVVCVMTPFDVISTRLYNQGVDARGRGLFYSGFFDCLWKILKREGPLGFYKGWSASWFRLAPHTVLNLTLWDILRKFFLDH